VVCGDKHRAAQLQEIGLPCVQELLIIIINITVIVGCHIYRGALSRVTRIIIFSLLGDKTLAPSPTNQPLIVCPVPIIFKVDSHPPEAAG
jgi:hypothetical protein